MYAIRSYYAISLKKNLIINDIVLEEQTQDLDGVTVVAKRPTVKRQIDRLVFNVENSTLSNSNVFRITSYNVCYTKLLRKKKNPCQ